MSLLSNTLTPKMGMKMVKNELEKKLSKKVDTFEIRFFTGKNIEFIIPDGEGKAEIYEFENNSIDLAGLIQSQLEKHTEKADKIDGFILQMKDESLNAAVFCTTVTNEKVLRKIKL